MSVITVASWNPEQCIPF